MERPGAPSKVREWGWRRLAEDERSSTNGSTTPVKTGRPKPVPAIRTMFAPGGNCANGARRRAARGGFGEAAEKAAPSWECRRAGHIGHRT